MTNCTNSLPLNASGTPPVDLEFWQFSRIECMVSTSTYPDPVITSGDMNIFLMVFLTFFAILFFGFIGLFRSTKIKKRT